MTDHVWYCPKCGSKSVRLTYNGETVNTLAAYCRSCTHVWFEVPLDARSRKPVVG